MVETLEDRLLLCAPTACDDWQTAPHDQALHAVSPMTSKSLAVSLLLMLAGRVPPAEALSETPSATVRIKSPKRDYLRGEPVLITVTITNDGKKDFPAWVVDVQYSIQFSIRRGTERFLKVQVYGGPWYKLKRYIDPLPPGKAKSYEFRILPNYAREKASALVLDKPGTYDVKVRYPLFSRSNKRSVEFESNTIQLRIHRPKGVDAKAWTEMERPRFLRFLQSAIAYRDKGEEYPPVTAARLLKKYPGSHYRPALHWALSEFTRHHPGWFNYKHLTPADVKLIKEALAAGGKIETSHFFPPLGIATTLLIACVVTLLVVRKCRGC